jgi:phage baseplate assembly protein W
MSVRQINRDPDYSDLDLDFIMNPSTNDVKILKGEASVKRSIRNLMLTNYFDRPFQSSIGSDIPRLLFEPTTSITQIQLEKAIRLCIENFEPRVSLQTVKVTYDPDEYGFNVRLEYVILNKNLPVVTTLFLERIR